MMKRSREDDDDGDHDVVEVGSRSKRRCGGGGGGSGYCPSSSEELSQRSYAYIKAVQIRFKDQPDLYNKFSGLLRDFRDQRIHAAALGLQIKKLFEGHEDLLLGFNGFMPEGYMISLDDDEDEEEEETQTEEEEGEISKSLKFAEALSFVNKVKLRFENCDEHVYQAFLDVIRNRNNMITTIEVAQLLGDHPDLLQDFDRLLGSHASATPPPAPPKPKAASDRRHCCNGSDPSVDDRDREIKTILFKQGLNLCNKVGQVLCDADYSDFLKSLRNYSNGNITKDDLKAVGTHILGSDQNLVEEFYDFMKAPEEQFSKLWKLKEEKKEQKKQIQSVNQLDLSKCQNISPSYWVLPEAYRVSLGRQRSENDEVLNDKLVCLSAGDESCPFKHKQIEEHEQILFKCENDRYEMDMVTEHIRSTFENVKKLLKAMEEKKINLESGIKIEDHLSIFNRRCIERLYGDHGLEIMEVLQEKPIKALPVILKRLEQKQQELKIYREELNKLCARFYAKSRLKKPAGKQQKQSRECSSEEMQKEDHDMGVIGDEQAADSNLQFQLDTNVGFL
ncbi:hypothetical protein ACOSQ2_006723 [Xanthoceras sorbifolium]